MTATEELRRLLDEQGVEHEDEDYKSYTYTYWGDWAFTEPLDAKPNTLGAQCELMLIPATPEQAIAVTLGSGTCEYVIEDNMNESEGMGDVWFRCTNCDTRYDYYADDWLLRMPHCPKCGATVKGVR